ncbi:F-box and WD repeat domain-containing 11-A-like isoform X3 [Bacillus rossius redtenbacheri]|uniref:F-box and WD repeat domain-containing 11-A-like isoform X3 n=1 Tax=Bacillus rossius redtenbacheri TaxID=93214 RepID=UPI002FDE3DA5
MSLRVTATVSETDKHSNDVTGLCFHDGKLYSAAEDGKVKVWTPELRKLAEFRAHDSAVFHLAALGDQLYTCSNDGSAVQAWDAASGERRTTLLGGGAEVWRLHAHDGKLYAGDAQGVVRIWSGDVLVRSFELTEEVRGLAVQGNLIYTVRDRDLVITETLAGEKSGPVTRQTIEGSSPLCLVGTRVCFASRSGVDILVHDNSKETRFKQLGIIKAHDMIMNALCGEGETTLYSGGYDGKLKKWDLSTLQSLGECPVAPCINAICAGTTGTVYVGASGGYIARIQN